MEYTEPDRIPEVWVVGDVILEKYEVREVFTGGGMGLVYRVYHRDWDIDLAVKSPRPNFFQSAQQVESFEREAQYWVNLGLHPHTTTCYYVRRLGAIPRIFAEFIEGGTLSSWIQTEKLYQGEKQDVIKRIIDISIQIARGLKYAHKKGLIHQDVKPGNVLMTHEGEAKVSDFGLANAVLAPEGKTGVAQKAGQSMLVTGAGFMTPEYASPEQASRAKLSGATDVWSWGLTVLEMLKGEMTWGDGRTAPFVLEEFYGEYLTDDPLASLLSQCFTRKPDDRPSFDSIIGELLRAYEVKFKSPYPRTEPPETIQTGDSLNNAAMSLLDLASTDGRNDLFHEAYEYLRKLENHDITHVDGLLNRILARWRWLQTPIVEVSRSLDNAFSIPGVLEETELEWLTMFHLETLQTLRAKKMLGRHRNPNPKIVTLINDTHEQVRSKLLELFYGSTDSLEESATNLLRESEFNELMSVSNIQSSLIACGGRREISVMSIHEGHEVFRYDAGDLFIENATLSENGKSISIMLSKVSMGYDANVYYSYHLLIHDLNGVNEDRKTREMTIPSGQIRMTVDDEGKSPSVWIKRFGYNETYQIQYEYDSTAKDYKLYHDLRVPSPIIRNVNICGSGDGKYLLVTSEDAELQLWKTSGATLRNCLLEFSLADFGVIDNRDLLPGFDINYGSDFKIDRWNIFSLLTVLRALIPKSHVPYRISKPSSLLNIQEDQDFLALSEKESERLFEGGDVIGAIAELDKCLGIRGVSKFNLLDKRFALLKKIPELYVSRCWHHTHIDEYWDSQIMAMESEADDQITLKRVFKIEHSDVGTGTVESHWDAWEGYLFGDSKKTDQTYGFAKLSDEMAIFLKMSVSPNLENSVVLLRRDMSIDLSNIWELPLPPMHAEQMYNHVVLIGDSLIIRDLREDSGKISIHDVKTGVEKKSINFSQPIFMIRRVAWNGVIALALTTVNDGKLFILSQQGDIISEISIVGDSTTVTDISLYGDALLYTQGVSESLWHQHINSGKTTCVWNCPANKIEVWNHPNIQRLSPCGRVVAYLCFHDLIVFDVHTERSVLEWTLPPGETVAPCFDLSGRWLTLCHMRNKREVFELMWDVIKQKVSI